MSITAPEAHHVHLPEKIVRGAEEYVDGLADLSSIMALQLPAVDKTAEIAHHVVAAEQLPPNGTRHGAVERLQHLNPTEQGRVMQLARTAIVASGAEDLLQHGRDQTATPDSRRLAIRLAHSALGRHYANLDRKRSVARHYPL